MDSQSLGAPLFTDILRLKLYESRKILQKSSERPTENAFGMGGFWLTARSLSGRTIHTAVVATAARTLDYCTGTDAQSPSPPHSVPQTSGGAGTRSPPCRGGGHGPRAPGPCQAAG